METFVLHTLWRVCLPWYLLQFQLNCFFDRSMEQENRHLSTSKNNFGMKAKKKRSIESNVVLLQYLRRNELLYYMTYSTTQVRKVVLWKGAVKCATMTARGGRGIKYFYMWIVERESVIREQVLFTE